MKVKVTFLILLLAALSGCSKQQERRYIVILPDISGSIDRQSLEQAFKAIDNMAGHLQRGDRITVIPIFADAQTEASGRIVRFEVPEYRRAYDADLRDFRHELGISLAQMQADATAHPGAKTDILGSIELAEQEFQLVTGRPRRLLIILSDFIQEDDEVDFRTDKRLTSSVAAKKFAVQIIKSTAIVLHQVPVYLGFLRSKEYAHIGEGRRAAIKEFWFTYFMESGATAEFSNDGPGSLGQFSSSRIFTSPEVSQ